MLKQAHLMTGWTDGRTKERNNEGVVAFTACFYLLLAPRYFKRALCFFWIDPLPLGLLLGMFNVCVAGPIMLGNNVINTYRQSQR